MPWPTTRRVGSGTPSLPAGTSWLGAIRHILLREWGQVTLADQSDGTADLQTFIGARANDEQMLDVIEAFFVALQQSSAMNTYMVSEASQIAGFRQRVNEILDDHELAYQLVGTEVIARESMAMHADVIAPALSLLHVNPRLEKVEKAFHDALSELKPHGNAADAITDAATALQEMLLALGAEGNSLGPLLSSARKGGLVGPHDSKLAEGVEKIGEWVSADRSTRGDAHGVTDADRDDAWLAVHVVGALILRLEKRV